MIPATSHLTTPRKGILFNRCQICSESSRFASAVTMCSVYDYDPKPQNDPMVSIINNFIDASASALMPEKAVLLKAFPFCECLGTCGAPLRLTSFWKCCTYLMGFLGLRSNMKRECPVSWVPRWSMYHTRTSKGAW